MLIAEQPEPTSTTLPDVKSRDLVVMGGKLTELGHLWAQDKSRPRVPFETRRQWDALLTEWKADQSLPLLIRKSSAVRGSELTHQTGRKLVPTDNAPAQWACHLAMTGHTYTLGEVRELFANGDIPASFAHKREEQDLRKYHKTLGKFSVNKKGWKLCHINPVGLNTRAKLVEADLGQLQEAFFKLLSPSNYFLLPLEWGGMGEVQAFIDGYKNNLPDEECSS